MKTKKVFSILLIIAIATSLCVVLTACNDNEITLELNKLSKTFNVTAGKTYTVNLTTYDDGVHELTGKLSAGSATVEFQQKGQSLFSSWKTTSTVKFNKGTNSHLFTVGTSDITIEDRTQTIGNSCRIRVTFDKDAKVSMGWYEYCDNIEANFSKYNYYSWKSYISPSGATDFYQYRTILYLNKTFSRVLGNVLENSSVKDSIKIFLNQKQITDDSLNKLTRTVKDSMSGVSKFQKDSFAKIICNALSSVFISGIKSAKFISDINSVAKVLKNTNTPQRVAFGIGMDTGPYANSYHLETSDVINAQGMYFLYGAIRHKGTFKAEG